MDNFGSEFIRQDGSIRMAAALAAGRRERAHRGRDAWGLVIRGLRAVITHPPCAAQWFLNQWGYGSGCP